VERHFSGQGYFVRSARTLTRLSKMVKTTRPEGILISDHLSTSHILSFLASLKELPDLWLIPILVVHDPVSVEKESNGGGGGGGEGEKERPRLRKKKGETANEEDDIGKSSRPSSLPSSSEVALQKQQQYHQEMLRLGVRAILSPSHPFPELQSLLEGARLTRQQVENLVDNLHGAILHFAQHRRRLLPSTMSLEGPPPSMTTTEQDVLNLLCRGMTDQQIAYSLGVTTATVGNAVRSLLEKFELDFRGELIRIALDNDLLTE
jgi:DNA-binding NarL/FixJ family response regulator